MSSGRLSREQEAIWLNDALSGDRSKYQLIWAHRLRGPLHAEALDRAFAQVVADHEALRSRFEWRDRHPVQVPGPAVAGLERRATAPDRLGAALEELRSHQLDLSGEGPVRGVLFEVGADDHVLALLMHHIVVDAMSMHVLATELESAYVTELRSSSPGEPRAARPAPTMGEYVAQEPVLDADDPRRMWWRHRLENAPALTTLPADDERPRELGVCGQQVVHELADDLFPALRAFASRQRTTHLGALTACLAVFVHRHTSQTDLVLGTPVTSRSSAPRWQRLVGCLTDVLPVRLRVEPTTTFAEAVRQTRRELFDVQRHRGVSFSEIVRNTVGPDQLDRFPLFQVVIGVDDQVAPTLNLPGLRIDFVEVPPATSKFDLLFRFSVGSGRITAAVDYAADLYGPATARRLVSRFETLLRAALLEPDLPIDQLDLLTEPERELVLNHWGQAPRVADVPLVHEAFDTTRLRTPDAIAVVADDVEVTYEQLGSAAEAIAVLVQARHHDAHPPLVGILMDRSVEMCAAVLGVLQAGSGYLPLDPGYPLNRLRLMLEDSGVRTVLTDGRHPELREVVAEVEFVDVGGWRSLGEGSAPLSPPQLGRDDLAYVMYTSGSTGRPKGVAMSHGPVAGLVDWQARDSASGPGDRTAQFSALGFDASFLEMFSTWATGGALVLVSEAERADYDELLRKLAHHRVSRMFLPFAALQSIAHYVVALDRPAPPLRELVCAGEQIHVTPAVREFFTRLGGAILFNQYGPSETHSVTSLRMDGDPATWPLRPPIGHPINSATVAVLDDRGRPVPIGVVGELCVVGPLGQGYWGREDLTWERFVPNMITGDGLMYRTGDRARLLPSGAFQFLGRNDDMRKIRGYRVELDEVEAHVRALAGVQDAVVVAKDVGPGDVRLVAHVHPVDGPAPATSTWRRELAATLPGYMVPSSFHLHDRAFPRSPNGKVDRARVALSTTD